MTQEQLQAIRDRNNERAQWGFAKQASADIAILLKAEVERLLQENERLQNCGNCRWVLSEKRICKQTSVRDKCKEWEAARS